MRRRTALLLSTMGLAVLLAAGVAYALDIQCQPGSNAVGKECLGTDSLDTMVGTEGNDDIRGLGDDQVFGGTGADDLIGSDLLSGGRGADSINALEASSNAGVDAIKGGKGNDQAFADDG